MSLPAASTGILTETNNEASASPQEPVAKTSYQSEVSLNLWRRGAVVGATLVCLGVLGAAISQLEVGSLVLLKLSGVVALVVAGVLAFEVAAVAKASSGDRSPLFLVGVGGASLICLAAIYTAFFSPQTTPLMLSALVGGPAMSAGAVILLRALTDRVWDAANIRTSLVPGFGVAGSKSIAENETFSISSGVVVPTDGRIRAGSCAVLERYLSTDVHYRVKDESDVVFAGSYVLGGNADVIALTGSYDSCLRRLEGALLPGVRWVEDSLRRDNERYVHQIAHLLTFVAVSCAIFWDDQTQDPVTVLVASGSVLLCSLFVQLGESLYALRCRLVRTWAQRGFLINSAKAWSELFNVREIACDPSTVAAETACHVRELELLDDRISERSLCGCIASILGRAEDRALSTVGDYCQQIVGAIDPDRIVDLREYDGHGISGSVKGVEFSIGSEEFLVQRGILIQPTESAFEAGSNDKVVLVAIGDDLIARFWVTFGQQGLLSEEGVAHWPKGLHGFTIESSSRELGSETLLVRGSESDSVGRLHSPEVAFFGRNGLDVPSSSVVAITSHIDLLPQLVSECRKHVRDVARARAWILFAGFVSLSLLFVGVVTPFLPIVLLPLLLLLIAL
jgi:cation transport ATPase